MMLSDFAADRNVMRYDAEAFENWYCDLQEKAGHRVDSSAARYLWERGYGIMDALVKITHA